MNGLVCFINSGRQKLLCNFIDGGKVELWDLETGNAVRSVRGHDEDAVTAIKVSMVTVFVGGQAEITPA